MQFDSLENFICAHVLVRNEPYWSGTFIGDFKYRLTVNIDDVINYAFVELYIFCTEVNTEAWRIEPDSLERVSWHSYISQQLAGFRFHVPADRSVLRWRSFLSNDEKFRWSLMCFTRVKSDILYICNGAYKCWIACCRSCIPHSSIVFTLSITGFTSWFVTVHREILFESMDSSPRRTSTSSRTTSTSTCIILACRGVPSGSMTLPTDSYTESSRRKLFVEC